MKRSLLVAALLLVVAGTALATGAVPLDGETDELDPASQSGIVLAPADSPNGERYAEFDKSGKLNITLDTVAGTATQVDDVFVVGFEGVEGSDDPADIQVEYENEAMSIIRMDTGDPVESENITVDPNESVTLGFEVDASTIDTNSFVETVTYRAVIPDPDGEGDTEVGTGGGQSQDDTEADTGDGQPQNDTEAEPDDPGETTEPNQTAPDQVVVDIEFDTGDRRLQDATAMDPSDLGETADPALTAPPRAVINRTSGDGLAFANEITSDAINLQTLDADALTQVGDTIALSGSRSAVNTSYAVDSQRRLAGVFDIPVAGADAEAPATINIPLDAARFNGTDPSSATIARQTDEGWQLLPTTVESRGGGELTLQARTPGFSVFGVFVESETTYRWESGDRSVEGRTADFAFDDPGLHRVNLTVTDSFGGTDTATYRVLVNDRPSVEIDPADIPANETVQLRANVTNTVGNESVIWTFADGSTTFGTAVEHTFERGERVSVTVEDEFGATGADEAVAGDGVTLPVLGVVEWQLSLGGRIAIVTGLAVLILGGLRWVIARRYYREERSRARDQN